MVVNKFALQGGIKYIDALGVNNLDLQVEGNVFIPIRIRTIRSTAVTPTTGSHWHPAGRQLQGIDRHCALSAPRPSSTWWQRPFTQRWGATAPG